MDAQRQPANADPAELAKFQGLASQWWDPAGKFKPLHDINPLRLDWIDQCVGLSGKSVLDVGCGGGILSESMARRGASVTGIDLATRPLQVARLHQLESGVHVRYLEHSAEALAEEEPQAYEVVTCLEMLEHVPDPGSTIAACARLMRPGGWAFFSTINRNPKSFLFAIVGAEYVLRLLPHGTHDYEKFIRPVELERGAREAGLLWVQSKGMTYNPLMRTYRLRDRDLSVNYLMAFRKP
ncbi:MAG: bifunctional 2-polyprenyl-6-hydroxyphenol methylase/3-demethylubiquinol 3-O-methyltransferase UbiG [Betaproteobacteria bacterium]